MRNGIVISWLPAIGLAWLVSGCASTPSLAVQQAGYPQDKVDARGLFTENCATCHGQDGRARTFHGWLVGAQNFTNARWQKDTSDADFIHAINTGPHMMPAFHKKLSVAEIAALAAYVRTFKPAS
ncbi:MAG TPA: cytochrome c [Verrucomicrobiae bacterium]